MAIVIKGTYVSRKASDMIIADNNFATIVAVFKEGIEVLMVTYPHW